jgi:hypothetical protein
LNRTWWQSAALLGALFIFYGCSDTGATTATATPPPPLVQDLQTPAQPGSSTPHLAPLDAQKVIMSWTEPRGEQHAVRMAVYDGAQWLPARDITVSDRLFVNWADFPSVVAGEGGVLFAHWLQRSGEDRYAYEIRVARSNDLGQTWSEPAVLHDDGTQTEHGFVSLGNDPGSRSMAVAWLDGRKMKPGSHDHAGDMTLRFARLGVDGVKAMESELDTRTCECCQTGMAITSAGPVIVYRDRSPEEIRDIAIVRWTGSGWSQPALVHPDGWKIPGCPVNGPQVDARGERVAVAWFTGANNESRVWVAFSTDGGATFRKPVRVDDGKPIGRVDLNMLEDGSALVSWLESGDNGAEVKVRKVRGNGVRGESVTAGKTTSARSSGFPRAAVLGDRAYIGWTVTGEPSNIRLALVDVKGLNR